LLKKKQETEMAELTITTYPLDELARIFNEQPRGSDSLLHLMSKSVLIIHKVVDILVKFAINVTDALVVRLDRGDIDGNKRKLSSAMRWAPFDIDIAKRHLRVNCAVQRKNMGLVFFYLDSAVSNLLYVIEGGYIPPEHRARDIMYSHLTQEQFFPDEPDSFMMPDTVISPLPIQTSHVTSADVIPVFQLPTIEPETGAERVSISRMVDIIRTLVVFLSTADGTQVIPDGDNLYAIEPSLGVVTPLEERQALRLFIASVSRDSPTLRLVCEDYVNLINACSRADKTFVARMAAANPSYATYLTAKTLSNRCSITMHSMAAAFSANWNKLPACVRCVLHLYHQN
jgi:hypothetical protein